jgi:pimeloyl-ACP methyl ester carboxylesterase
MYTSSITLLFAMSLSVVSVASSPACGVEHACRNILPPQVEGAVIQHVTGAIYRNRSVPITPPTLLQDVHHLNFCEVNVTLTHPGEDDLVQIQTWLPLNTWNERYLGVGGAAWAAGFGTPDLAIPASQGYAVSSTDAGLPFNPLSPEAWVLGPDGAVNIGLLTNFAHRSIHDLAVVGKHVTEAFYGQAIKSSFFNGCSTGGRQALATAQRYPEDFDGILAGSPAIYWTEYVVAELWPQVVMKQHGHFLTACELEFFRQVAIDTCDNLDGVEDGVLNDPASCHIDARTFVNRTLDCDGKDLTVSLEAANVVNDIWAGPSTPSGSKLWAGLFKGASLAALANSTNVNGTVVGMPFFVANDWARFFVKQDPNFKPAEIDQAGLANLFIESKTHYDNLIGSADPDLNLFHQAGGKVMITHGLADDIIYPQGSVKYFEEVQATLGSEATTNFMRLFLSPGVDHCATAQSIGAVPTDPFGALVRWVEDDQAPDELAAKTSSMANSPQFTRKVCAYPGISKYNGFGDATDASSYVCSH